MEKIAHGWDAVHGKTGPMQHELNPAWVIMMTELTLEVDYVAIPLQPPEPTATAGSLLLALHDALDAATDRLHQHGSSLSRNEFVKAMEKIAHGRDTALGKISIPIEAFSVPGVVSSWVEMMTDIRLEVEAVAVPLHPIVLEAMGAGYDTSARIRQGIQRLRETLGMQCSTDDEYINLLQADLDSDLLKEHGSRFSQSIQRLDGMDRMREHLHVVCQAARVHLITVLKEECESMTQQQQETTPHQAS